jgi:hypothetical protein
MRGRSLGFLPPVTVLELHILERLLFVLVGDETKLPLQIELIRRQSRLLLLNLSDEADGESARPRWILHAYSRFSHSKQLFYNSGGMLWNALRKQCWQSA